MAVREFGIRDLRNHTSTVLDAVAAGETVYLTNRGHRVAEIRSVEGRAPIETLIEKARLVSAGDSGALDELLNAKRADTDAQAAKEEALWA